MLSQQEYEKKVNARLERWQKAAQRAAAASEAAYSGAKRIGDMIPLGQPILIGHHSESRARRDAERIRNGYQKGYALYKQSQDLKARAAAAADNSAIYADNPSALSLIQTEIDELELTIEKMKAVNKWIRSKGKNTKALDDVGLTPVQAKDSLGVYQSEGCFPSYALSNRGANLRRLKERLKDVEAKQAIPNSQQRIGDVVIYQNADIMRTQIEFGGKPLDSIIKELKASGFRWSPDEKRWQRLIGRYAYDIAEKIATKIAKGEFK